METVSTALDAWETFFAAELGAAAALGGLVFVGLSLNLTKILSFPDLPSRALLALILLMLVIIVAGRMLIPNPSPERVGIEVMALGGVVLVMANRIELSAWTSPRIKNRVTFLINLALLEFALAPYLIGGVLLMLDNPDGLHFIAFAMALSFVKAMTDAWVLLVEINR